MAISQQASAAIIAEILSDLTPPSGVAIIIEQTRVDLANAGCSVNLPNGFEEYYQRLMLGRI